MNNYFIWSVVFLVSLGACATHKEKMKPVAAPKPFYHSPAELFKSENCSKQVEQSHQDQSLVLKPRVQLLEEDADIFCVQKLKKHARFLKVTSKLEPWVQEGRQIDLKFLATTFDLVVYDQTMTKLSLAQPIYRLSGTEEFYAYYNFSKLKKFPAYFAILFKPENREKVVFTQKALPSKEAMSGHSAITSAAGVAMGGFAAGSAVSVSQPKEMVNHTVYSKTPSELKVEWVRAIAH